MTYDVRIPLSIDTSRPVRSRAEQQAFVRAVFEAPPGSQETDWLEWKGPLKLAGRNAARRAAIAKAVLGFSNRNPDLAARNMGGSAYFLAGVSPGRLEGVEVVDAAQLEDQTAGFVRRDISWRADYMEIDGTNVLIVTVEPPRWGDPAHPARKTFNPEGGGRSALQEGTVYVRHQASTERATAADIDMLSRRVSRRPGDELQVEVSAAPETGLRPVDVSVQTIERYVAQRQAILLTPLTRVGVQFAALSPFLSPLNAEYRSEKDYRAEVSNYIDVLRRELPNVLRARAVLHGIARLRLQVVNNTDTTFTKVRVEARLWSGQPTGGELSATRRICRSRRRLMVRRGGPIWDGLVAFPFRAPRPSFPALWPQRPTLNSGLMPCTSTTPLRMSAPRGSRHCQASGCCLTIPPLTRSKCAGKPRPRTRRSG